jgi:hypothetical protein
MLRLCCLQINANEASFDRTRNLLDGRLEELVQRRLLLLGQQ